MARILASKGNEVIASDLYARGFGESGVDFLSAEREVDNIVTNPPYNAAEGFVKAGLRNAKRKFALLLRLAFLEGANRYRTIFSVAPPSRIWAFSERITFYPAGAIKKGQERLPMLGSSGTRVVQARLNSGGLNPVISAATHKKQRAVQSQCSLSSLVLFQ